MEAVFRGSEVTLDSSTFVFQSFESAAALSLFGKFSEPAKGLLVSAFPRLRLA